MPIVKVHQFGFLMYTVVPKAASECDGRAAPHNLWWVPGGWCWGEPAGSSFFPLPAASVVSAGTHGLGAQHFSVWRTSITYPCCAYLVIALLVNKSLSNGYNSIL